MRQPRRESHTRFGWWVMKHDRGGAGVIGVGAAAVLVADLLYAISHWSGSFPRAFLISLAAVFAVVLIALALRLLPRIGAGRRAVRWNQRGVNVVLILVLVAFIEINRVGGNGAGGTLGAVAALAGGFAIYTAVWLARKRA